ncbi:WG repeat-containing protein [Marinigracilibium pacificum]|uniref:WG repeat-containing protein n=1 Tax=Marinigracilibium pacificum TaxID=2729599 RepID=A0A848JCN6_9BACT|nr:WG repeat-containing protein [Marinigracilibium pacificum]NMM50762.1 WG repeat-containing protein [Marinigracilibium pacificum]
MRHLLFHYFLLIVILCSGCSVLEAQSKKERKALKVWVKQDGKWGLINGMEEWIVEPQYANCLSVTNDMAIVTYLKDSLIAKGEMRQHVVVNNSGKEILTFEAIEAEFTTNFDHIIYKTITGVGAMNKLGEQLVKPEYENLEEDASDENRFIAIKDKKYGLIDDKGEVLVPFEYENINTTNFNRYIARNNSKFGVIDGSNNVIVSFNYSMILPNMVINFYKSKVLYNEVFAEIGNESFLIDLVEGEKILEENKGYPLNIVGDINILPYESEEGFKYVNRNNKTILRLPQNFTYISFFSEDRAVFGIKKDNEKFYGVIDRNGEIVVEPKYSWIDSFKNGRAAFRLDGKYGYFDKNGVVKIDHIYKQAFYFDQNGLAMVMRDHKIGCIDQKGKVVIPIIFNSIEVFNGKFYFCSGQSPIIVNSKGEYILKDFYEDFRVDSSLRMIYRKL